MPKSEKDVEELQASVENKRAQLEKARRERIAREMGVSNEIAAAQLLVEEARLDRELAAEKAASTVTAVREGAAGTIADAKDAMTAALEGQKADAELVASDAAAAADDEKKKEN